MNDKLSHMDSAGAARMVDVSAKAVTVRRAVVEGFVRCNAALIEAIRNDGLAKGNLLETARIAGIMAAKKTSDLIPLCHSLPLDKIDVEATLTEEGVALRAEAITAARTGVEMEAFTAVSVAALTVVDMGKAVDKGMIIEGIRLVHKSGGKSGVIASMSRAPFTVAILTVSDRCSSGEGEDTSGPALQRICDEVFGATIQGSACVPDEREAIQARLRAWSGGAGAVDCILSTGGTGLAPRDITPEATLELLDCRHDGLMELIRMRGYAQTAKAYLSRGEAGVIGRTLVINLPGSKRGATESLQALRDVLPHAIETLRGDVKDHVDQDGP